MRWKKLGRIFCPDNLADWMVSHAANPVAKVLGDNLVRVYFSCRDRGNRSSIAFFETDLRRPEIITRLSKEPVVRPGPIGAFDDSGAAMGCLVESPGRHLLYYLGWNLGVTVPWRNSIGLAVSEDGESFERYSLAPILDRSDVDPFSISYPWVIRDDKSWKMWYGSNTRWGSKQEDMEHVIKFAESEDGIRWHRSGRIIVGHTDPDEYAIAKPCVLREDGLYKMWYSFRGPSYRIGYAESGDGLSWTRRDGEVGIDVSLSGWDSEMIEYAFVFDCQSERYMLYNGNGYGRTGVGLAIADS